MIPLKKAEELVQKHKNLENDLSEMKDLSKEKPDKTAELNNILEKYLISVKAPKWKEGITWKKQKLEEFNSSY